MPGYRFPGYGRIVRFGAGVTAGPAKKRAVAARAGDRVVVPAVDTVRYYGNDMAGRYAEPCPAVRK